jgi:hypothetical protein
MFIFQLESLKVRRNDNMKTSRKRQSDLSRRNQPERFEKEKMKAQ